MRGYANYNATFKDIETKDIDTNQLNKNDLPKNTNAIQYGLELAWLWDLVHKGKHTLGIDLGTGFEGSTFFHSTKMQNDNDGQVTSRLVGSNTQVVWVSRIGLHYYFNVNHQIGLAYAYKGSYTEVDGQNQDNPNGQSFGKFATSPHNQILLSYAYKF